MRGPLLSDLDGTIVDTAPAIFESLHVACAAFDVELASDADLSWCLGPPLHECLTGLGVAADVLPDAIAVFETAHTERIDLCVAMPGAEIVLPALVDAGVRIGVATIKPQNMASYVLEAIGLRACVVALYGRSSDMDPRTKTDLLRECTDDAAITGSSPLYVGDHDNDEIAAGVLQIPFLRYPDHSWDEIGRRVLG